VLTLGMRAVSRTIGATGQEQKNGVSARSGFGACGRAGIYHSLTSKVKTGGWGGGGGGGGGGGCGGGKCFAAAVTRFPPTPRLNLGADSGEFRRYRSL